MLLANVVFSLVPPFFLTLFLSFIISLSSLHGALLLMDLFVTLRLWVGT